MGGRTRSIDWNSEGAVKHIFLFYYYFLSVFPHPRTLMIPSCHRHYEYINTLSNDFSSVFRREWGTEEADSSASSGLIFYSIFFFFLYLYIIGCMHISISLYMPGIKKIKKSFLLWLMPNSLVKERRVSVFFSSSRIFSNVRGVMNIFLHVYFNAWSFSSIFSRFFNS